ncbi:Fc.00g012160.m01.CDS01 [Cosmosporella sp. VM-42]
MTDKPASTLGYSSGLFVVDTLEPYQKVSLWIDPSSQISNMATTEAEAPLPSSSGIDATLRVLPARTGISVTLAKDQLIQIINTHGKQVVDTWALESRDPTSHLSMEHTRASLQKLSIEVGDTLVSNGRAPMLTVVADTTPGVHDTLISACDTTRYAQLGVNGYHANCADNFHGALQKVGVRVQSVPSPLNLFMNVPVAPDGSLQFARPVSEPGQFITLRADVDLVLVMSSCPQDMTPVNGVSCTEIHFRVI